MHSDFSARGKSARELIPVPALAMDSIRLRSHTAAARDRARAFIACAAITIGALGAAAGFHDKIYDGIQFWLSGNRGAIVVHSMAVMSPPIGHDLRAVSAKATFPVVYPVGLPVGTRIIRIMYAPADHPTSITLQYVNPRTGFNAGLTLVDSTVVNSTNLPMSSDGRAPRYGTVEQWGVGGETVVAFKGNLAPSYVRAIEVAMRSTSPSASLSESEAMLWKLRSVGAPYQLADTAERLAPNGSVVGRGELRLIPGLNRTHQPLLLAKVMYLTNIPYADGIPQYNRASQRWVREVAASSDGVRAIAAVMAAAGESGRWTDCCEILYTPASKGSYTLWTLPMSSSAAVKRYLVDAKTYQVRAVMPAK